MSQWSSQHVLGCTANQSIPAYVCVTRAATTTAMGVCPFNTATANILGVSLNNASTGDSVAIVYGGTTKVYCAASVSLGAIVGPNTATANLTGGIGSVIERATFTSTLAYKTIGVALESGSTNSLIEVLITIANTSGA